MAALMTIPLRTVVLRPPPLHHFRHRPPSSRSRCAAAAATCTSAAAWTAAAAADNASLSLLIRRRRTIALRTPSLNATSATIRLHTKPQSTPPLPQGSQPPRLRSISAALLSVFVQPCCAFAATPLLPPGAGFMILLRCCRRRQHFRRRRARLRCASHPPSASVYCHIMPSAAAPLPQLPLC